VTSSWSLILQLARLKLILFQHLRLIPYTVCGYKKLRTKIETENVQRLSICHNITNYKDNVFTFYKKRRLI